MVIAKCKVCLWFPKALLSKMTRWPALDGGAGGSLGDSEVDLYSSELHRKSRGQGGNVFSTPNAP